MQFYFHLYHCQFLKLNAFCKIVKSYWVVFKELDQLIHIPIIIVELFKAINLTTLYVHDKCWYTIYFTPYIFP